MYVTTPALILSSLKYGDSSLIVKAYTEAEGLKSYLLRGILTSKKGKLRPALFQPLTQLEIVAHHKNKGSLESIREAKVLRPYQTLHSDVIKNSMLLFLAEMLTNCLQEEEENRPLYQYLVQGFDWLDTHETSANFHLLFLINLTRFLGFYPDDSNIEGTYFDLLEGSFITTPNLNPLMEHQSATLLKQFLGMDFDAIASIKTTKQRRLELLNKLILYFELHLQGFRKPRSLAVLNAVFQ